MKNSFKNASYNAFGFVFPISLALFTTPYIVHKLTPEVYGVYVIAISLMGLLVFLDLGFGQGVIKFVSQYDAKKDYDHINKIISVSLLIYIVMGLVGSTLIFCLSDLLSSSLFKISEEYVATVSLGFKVVAIGFFFNFIKSVLSNIPKALQRYDISVKIQNAVWFFSIMSTVALLYLGQGLVAILISYIFYQLVAVVIYYFACKRILPTIRIIPRFEKAVFKEVFSFCVFTAINSISGSVLFKVDKIIVAGFLGAEAVAYYQIPFMIAQMANGFMVSISQFLFPATSHMYSSGDHERLRECYFKSTRYILCLATVIVASLLFLGDHFIVLWMGREFAQRSRNLIQIISIIYFFHASGIVAFWFYNGLGKPKINAISSTIACISYLLASVFLIPKFGLIGAALAFGFTLIPFPVYIYILNTSIMRVGNKWLLGKVAKSIFILSFVIGLTYLIALPPGVMWFSFAGLSVVVFSVVVSYFLKIIYLEDILSLKSNLKLGGAKS